MFTTFERQIKTKAGQRRCGKKFRSFVARIYSTSVTNSSGVLSAACRFHLRYKKMRGDFSFFCPLPHRQKGSIVQSLPKPPCCCPGLLCFHYYSSSFHRYRATSLELVSSRWRPTRHNAKKVCRERVLSQQVEEGEQLCRQPDGLVDS